MQPQRVGVPAGHHSTRCPGKGPSAGLLAIVAVVFAILPMGAAGAAQAINLRTATDFAVLAGSAITNTGATTIVGDVGSSPTPAITGFETVVLTGTNHGGDAVTVQAKTDLEAGYAEALAASPVTPVDTELGGRTLTPGVYGSGTLGINGTLTLDALGDPNAVFVFQASTTLITAAASSVSFVNGLATCNVFWQVGSSATLGANSLLVGSVLAHTSITVGAGTAIEGRLLAMGGAVTLSNNAIGAPACAAAATTTTTAAPTTTTTTAPAATTTTTAAPPATTTTTTAPAATTTTTAAPATTTTTTTAPPTTTGPPVTIPPMGMPATVIPRSTPIPPENIAVPPGSTTATLAPPGLSTATFGQQPPASGPAGPERSSWPRLPRTGMNGQFILAGLGAVVLGLALVSLPGRRRMAQRRPRMTV